METPAPTVDGSDVSHYFDSYDDLDVSGARWQKYCFKENSIIIDVLYCVKRVCVLWNKTSSYVTVKLSLC
jgi:hypothetical protein